MSTSFKTSRSRRKKSRKRLSLKERCWPRLTTVAGFSLMIVAFGAFLFYSYFTALAQEEPGDSLNSSIHAQKFEDMNGNGMRDENEAPVEGWEICLYRASLLGEEGEGGSPELVNCEMTNEEGWVFWTALEPGNYWVMESKRAGWQATTDSEISLKIEEGNEEQVYFGNRRILGSIRAFKFYDLDRSSDYNPDRGDMPLEGWQICLYAAPFSVEDGTIVSENEPDCKTTGGGGWTEPWTSLELGEYGLLEEDRENWSHTTQDIQTAHLTEASPEWSAAFGNKRGHLVVHKYDYNTEKVISGWNICLYEAVLDEGESEEEYDYALGALVECKETIDDYNEAEDYMGPFHGAALFFPEHLDPDKLYIVDEEERAGWRLDTWDWNGAYEEARVISRDSGQVLVRFSENFFRGGDFDLYLYNFNFTGEIVAFKYFRDQGPMAGWNICLDRLEWSGEEDGQVRASLGCKLTDASGIARWANLFPGEYIVEEETRADEGWIAQSDPEQRLELAEGGERAVYFYNWIDDRTPPVSSFKSGRDHEVISTEIVTLELSGFSQDPLAPINEGEDVPYGSAGVGQAQLRIRQLLGSEGMENYPSESFFDVFNELNCPDSEAVPIEIVGLNLASVNPITAQWDYGWQPSSMGVYCFEVSATDYAGNVEHTAYAGPVAYVPVVSVSEQVTSEPTETSFNVSWTTGEPATSRVIYDTVSHEIVGAEPNYGYAQSTSESDTDPKVTSHSVLVTGLTSGTTYYYRTVSRASPASVSGEGSITTAQSSSASSGGGGGGASNGGNIGGGGSGIISYPLPLPQTPTPLVAVPIPAPILTPSPSPQPQVLGAATYQFQFKRSLRFGSLGQEVRELQRRLTWEGVYTGPITGRFGLLTFTGVKAYQAKYGIHTLGMVGPATRAHLNR